MTREEARNLVASCNLMEYGVYARPLVELLSEKAEPNCLVTALNNADTDGVLLELLRQKPRSVFDGMAIAALAAGVDKKILYLPEFCPELLEQLRPLAEQSGVCLEIGIVDCRAHENSVLCHIVTMAELSEAAAGTFVPGIWVCVNGGALEKLPGDTPLRELLDGQVKAVRTGYTMRSVDALELTLEEAGIENGVLQGLTDETCVVEYTENYLHSCRAQSCGKCVFCREGLIQLEEFHRDITQNRGKAEALALMAEVGEAMTYSTPCSMGQKSALLPLTAMQELREEYEAHVAGHRCPANSCLSFVRVYINPDICTGCGQCRDVCPVHAIDGRPGYIHMVDTIDCTKCGACLGACPEKAVVCTTGRMPLLPDRFILTGKFRWF